MASQLHFMVFTYISLVLLFVDSKKYYYVKDAYLLFYALLGFSVCKRLPKAVCARDASKKAHRRISEW